MSFIALALPVIGQEVACCCDPFAQSGFLDSEVACNAKGWTFFPGTEACNEVCETAELTPPSLEQCGAPGFYPSPKNITVSPIKGKPQLQLQWDAVCPADSFVVYRCTDLSCESTELIGVVNGGLKSFIDPSTLLWKQQQTYRVEAIYGVQESVQSEGTGNAGDIECWNQITVNNFCVSKYYYFNFENYLETNGYLEATPNVFSEDLEQGVKDTFNEKFNKAYTCDGDNNLLQTNECPSTQVCVIETGIPTGTPACLEVSDCSIGGGVLGLGFDADSCEKPGGQARYCFFDKSSTVSDTCYACDQRLGCYDYKSEGACNRNACGKGNCEWHSTAGLEDLGIGVCVNTQIDNCQLCDKKGTELDGWKAPNIDVYNEIFDACTQDKADALEVGGICFFIGGSASGCESIGCSDYKSISECSSPVGGIQRDSNRELIATSNDVCNIKVCQWDAALPVGFQCRKNSDANTINFPDCEQEDEPCEKDYFSPNSTLLPIIQNGKYTYLGVKISDKERLSEEYTLRTSLPNPPNSQPLINHKIKFCSYLEGGTPCTTYDKIMDVTLLNFNNLDLQNGQEIVHTFDEGSNIIRYSATDLNNNEESINEVSIVACKICTGPILLSFVIPDSRFIERRYYTKSTLPIITATLNTKASISFSTFTQGGLEQPISIEPQEASNEFTFSPDLLSEGEYQLSFNVKNETTGVFMEIPDGLSTTQGASPPVFDIIVDSTPPSIVFTPGNGSTINISALTIEFLANEKIIINNITLIERTFMEDYVFVDVPTDFTKMFVLHLHQNLVLILLC